MPVFISYHFFAPTHVLSLRTLTNLPSAPTPFLSPPHAQPLSPIAEAPHIAPLYPLLTHPQPTSDAAPRAPHKTSWSRKKLCCDHLSLVTLQGPPPTHPPSNPHTWDAPHHQKKTCTAFSTLFTAPSPTTNQPQVHRTSSLSFRRSLRTRGCRLEVTKRKVQYVQGRFRRET